MEKKYGRGTQDEEGVCEVGVGKGYVCFRGAYLAGVVIGSYIAGIRGETGQH